MTTETNDPLAGVPAKKHEQIVRKYAEVYPESLGALDAVAMLEHIAHLTQENRDLSAKLAAADRQAVADGLTITAAAKLLADTDAQVAAMREAIGNMLAHYWAEVKKLASFGYDDLPAPTALEALQDAISGDAGRALLAERDELAARVKRLEQDLSMSRAEALRRLARRAGEGQRVMPPDYRSTAKELPREGSRVAWPWDSGEMRGEYSAGVWRFEISGGAKMGLLYPPKRWRYLKLDER